MKKEFDKKLVEAFPLLYGDRHASTRLTAMCWGFSCGDGWFDIIWNLSSKLEPLIQKFVDDNPIACTGNPKASQVKEKFGGLRFYMTHTNDEISDLIGKAEALSYKTCENCGKPGEERTGSWIRTLCDTCSENIMEIRKKRVEEASRRFAEDNKSTLQRLADDEGENDCEKKHDL